MAIHPANIRCSISSAINIPYITNAMLFPTSIVEMKLLGLWKKMDRIREVRLFSLRSISKRSLLEDTNAISMPEKNAENAMVMMICMRIFMIVYRFRIGWIRVG